MELVIYVKSSYLFLYEYHNILDAVQFLRMHLYQFLMNVQNYLNSNSNQIFEFLLKRRLRTDPNKYITKELRFEYIIHNNHISLHLKQGNHSEKNIKNINDLCERVHTIITDFCNS